MSFSFADPVGAHRNVGIPLTRETWSNQSFTGDDLASVIFVECVFEQVQFENINLHQTTFVGCRFDQCTWKDCEIRQTRWVQCKGQGYSIKGGILSEAVISESKFKKLVLEQEGFQLLLSSSEIEQMTFNNAGCKQSQLTISDCQFKEVQAENALWDGANIVGIDLSPWRLDNAQIKQSSMVRTEAVDFDFSTIEFTRCNLYQSNLTGARVTSAEGCIFAECQLEGTNFKSARLKGALFSKALAHKACFDESEIEGALFPSAILTSASFLGANAKNSVWIEADLTDANLQQVNAYRASFKNAVIDKTNVDQASLVETDLHGVEQQKLKGAILTNARGTIEWRAEIEKQTKK